MEMMANNKTDVNKFSDGETVFERINPGQKLMVRRYVNKIYYCMVEDFPNRKDLVFFERELMASKTVS
jgi:hypothetical protein